MEKYSYLIGTDERNTRRIYYEDKGMKEFLGSLGARIYDMATDAVNELFFNFSKGTRYEQAAENSKPVSRMYCSMNLSRLSIQPFAAYGVCGAHASGDMDGKYMQIYIGPQEQLYGIEFFDQVFGMRFVSEEEVRNFDPAGEPINASGTDSKPKSVLPVIDEEDRAAVCGIVEQIYNKKNIVIRLEPGVDFNKRATELLVQIYAMMPPVKRIQTGFVTYKNTEEILNIALDSTVKLYVVPHEESALELLKQGFSLYDMESAFGSELDRSDLYDLLYKWSFVHYAEREETAKSLERELLLQGYSETDLYPKLIENYFDPQQWWWENEEAKGTIRDLTGLVDKHKETVILKTSPAINERFRKKSGNLFAEGHSLNHMLLDCIDNPNDTNAVILDYCINSIGFNDISIGAVKTYKLRRDEREQNSIKEMARKHAAEIEGQKFVHSAQIEGMNEKHAAEIEDLMKRQKTEAGVLTNNRAGLDEEQRNLYTKQAEEIVSRHKAEIEDLKAEHAIFSKELKNKHEIEVNELIKKHTVQVEDLINKHTSEIAALKAEFSAKMEKLSAVQSDKVMPQSIAVHSNQEDLLDKTLRSARLSVSNRKETDKFSSLKYNRDLGNLKSGLIGLWNQKVLHKSSALNRSNQNRPAEMDFGSIGNEPAGLKSNYTKLMYELEKVRGNKLYYENRAEKLESDITVLNEKIQNMNKRNRSPKAGFNLFVGTCGGILLCLLVGIGLLYFGVLNFDEPIDSSSLLSKAAPYTDEFRESDSAWESES